MIKNKGKIEVQENRGETRFFLENTGKIEVEQENKNTKKKAS